ncbi:hypothetical protein [Herbihabitans rhizosphaerae]|uniref:hypothetical protein n=1 Tax=Herbihabitans rhizosphaerae TaxID=1872711 RepID=UPI00102C4839|nr:hypothetical protein [Herbihabitans rhizosphaerae]
MTGRAPDLSPVPLDDVDPLPAAVVFAFFVVPFPPPFAGPLEAVEVDFLLLAVDAVAFLPLLDDEVGVDFLLLAVDAVAFLPLLLEDEDFLAPPPEGVDFLAPLLLGAAFLLAPPLGAAPFAAATACGALFVTAEPNKVITIAANAPASEYIKIRPSERDPRPRSAASAVPGAGPRCLDRSALPHSRNKNQRKPAARTTHQMSGNSKYQSMTVFLRG